MRRRPWTDAQINAALKEVDRVRAATGDKSGLADIAEFGFAPAQMLRYAAAHADNMLDRLAAKNVTLTAREGLILGFLDGLMVGVTLEEEQP